MKLMKSRHHGFSLVELMISMVLGIVIVGGCIAVFGGVVGSSSLNQTVSNLQSKARFALDQIGRDVRAAGFMGCAAERNVSLNVTVDSPPTTDLNATALSGYVVGENSWSPEYPMSYTPATGVGAPVAGTHALSVQYAQFPGFVFDSSMTSSNSPMVFERDDDTSIREDQLMVVSDCSTADLFSISSVTKSSATITVSSEEVLTKPYTAPSGLPDTARGMPFISTIYYVGDTGRTTGQGNGVYSLYAHSYPYTSDNPPIELVEGVDQLVLEFGVRQNDGSLAYVSAGDTGYSPEGIQTLRVGILLSSNDSFDDVDDSREYILAGKNVTALASVSSEDDAVTSVAAGSEQSDNAETNANSGGDTGGGDTGTAASTVSSDTLTYVLDKRLRMPFNATFNVRNRNF